MSTLLKDLRAARALIEVGWVQGMFAGAQLDAQGHVSDVNVMHGDATCFCMWGACRRVACDIEMNGRLDTVLALANELPDDPKRGKCGKVAEFNDTEGRTKEEVLAVFDAAITTELRRILTEALNGLKDSRTDDDVGICFNLSRALETPHRPYASAYQLVNKLSWGWEHHSGNETYPVPRGFDNEKWYGNWGGNQGFLRLNLIDYLVSKISVTEGSELSRLSGL